MKYDGLENEGHDGQSGIGAREGDNSSTHDSFSGATSLDGPVPAEVLSVITGNTGTTNEDGEPSYAGFEGWHGPTFSSTPTAVRAK